MKETKFNIGDLAIGLYNGCINLWRVEEVITTTRQSEYSTDINSKYLCQMATYGEMTMHNTFNEFELYTKEEFTEMYNEILAKYEKKEKS